MGVDVYSDNVGKEYESFVFVCNTSDQAVSGVLYGTKEQAFDFLNWLPRDVRTFNNEQIDDLFIVFKKHFSGVKK